MAWQGVTALILGAILLACGVVLFVSAHWDEMGRGARFALVLAMVTVFHVAGGLVRDKYYGLGTALHAVGTIATGAAIALTGQIFNINEHWPAAVLMWALAALAGWALLRDQAQQILALLLVPAWMLSEFEYRAQGHIGSTVYDGRMLFVWSILYLTFVAPATQGCARIFVCGVGGDVDHGRDFHDRDMDFVGPGSGVSAVRSACLGMDRNCNGAFGGSCIPRAQRADSDLRLAGIAFHHCPALVPLPKAHFPTRTAMGSRKPITIRFPTWSRTQWWQVSRSFCAGGECVLARACW